jgi:4-amino-4-deoxy-L-arabinose transferase-like glycosyltransferase
MSAADLGLQRGPVSLADRLARRYQVVVLLFASITFISGVISPPYLMDDVDAVQAQIARNMLDSGDFVTPRLDGIAYMEKAPLKYWLIALFFRIFGVHDWAARLVIGVSAVLTCWITARFAAWAIGDRAGLFAGLILSTCIGPFLFTRMMIPDPLLMVFVVTALYAFMRALEEPDSKSVWWARTYWAAMAFGVLTKGLIAVIFPIGAAVLFLFFTRRFFVRETWLRLVPFQGTAIFLIIAAPWHILATLANPPYFDFTMHSESGSYHGFFWFYFINEHVLRFLNLRYPRDYNTVPRPLFWLFHLVWFFPWSVYLLRYRKLTFGGNDRASRLRLLALCWAGFVMVFFTFSTTQEYYSLSAYPAFAILLGSALALPEMRFEPGARVAATIAAMAAVVIAFILWNVRNLDAPGDIADALAHNPDLYTLSLGHMADLTFRAFAYLRVPLFMALLATLVGAFGGWLLKGTRALLALAVMMVLFFQAARAALIVFDPYLGSKGLADALVRSPKGDLIVDDQYYSYSSVFFYANRRALLLNGRVNNLEYGSYAPGAPNVFLKDADVPVLWSSSARWYLIADGHEMGRFERLLGKTNLHQVAEAGNKYLFVNH